MEKVVVVICMVFLLLSVFLQRRILQVLPAVLLGSILAIRTSKAGYPPLFDPFDSILLFALIFILVSITMKVNIKVSGILSLLFILPLPFVKSNIHTLPPIIKTPLFIIHVSTAMLGYALFIVASLLSLLNIIYKENLDIRKVASWGLVSFSASLIVGGIWAFLAWADLFPIEPKSLFSLLTWAYFALLLHLKFDKQLSRIKDAAFIAGGVLVLFTFLGVNYLMRGTHAF